jgi:thiol-disulfide isomerase/thioredoxin
MTLRNRIVLALAAGAALFAGVMLSPKSDNTGAQSKTSIENLRKQALTLLDGNVLRIHDIKAPIVVVNYWATWCGPCKEEMPSFVSLQNELGAQKLQFVGIAIDRKEPADRFAREIGVNYPIAIGQLSDLEATAAFGNAQQALPFSMILDANGNSKLTRLGKLNIDEIRLIASKSSVK